jgi:hypothetical protein
VSHTQFRVYGLELRHVSTYCRWGSVP